MANTRIELTVYYLYIRLFANTARKVNWEEISQEMPFTLFEFSFVLFFLVRSSKIAWKSLFYYLLLSLSFYFPLSVTLHYFISSYKFALKLKKRFHFCSCTIFVLGRANFPDFVWKVENWKYLHEHRTRSGNRTYKAPGFSTIQLFIICGFSSDISWFDLISGIRFSSPAVDFLWFNLL